jgi:hypothetical protein
MIYKISEIAVIIDVDLYFLCSVQILNWDLTEKNESLRVLYNFDLMIAILEKQLTILSKLA